MKNIVILMLAVGAIFWFIKSDSDINKLMEVDDSVVILSSSGINDVYPEPGSEIDADILSEYGVPTVIYLHMDSCDACKPVENAVNRLVSYRPDVAVKRLHVKYGYGLRLFSEGENLWSTHSPFVVIYDKSGRLVSTDIGEGKNKNYDGYHMLFEWTNAEAKKAS